MGWQVPQRPPMDLAGDVACVWSATVEGHHRLVPDGCADILWLQDGATWVCGPETTAWEFALPAGTSAVGVRLRPGVAPRVLGLPGEKLTNTRIRLEDVVGGRFAREVAQRVGESDDRVAALTGLLRPLIHAAPSAERPDVAASRLLVAPSPPSVDRLAALTGLTVRQVHRRAVRAFGYPPTTLVRLVRFQRWLRRAETGRWRTITELAHAAGYSDHAHLVRDCRAVAGVTPTQLLAEHAPTFPGTSDPYKTPPSPPTMLT